MPVRLSERWLRVVVPLASVRALAGVGVETIALLTFLVSRPGLVFHAVDRGVAEETIFARSPSLVVGRPSGAASGTWV